MPDAPDPTMPAPALTDDASFTPPEQPPMLDDDDASGLVNGQEDRVTGGWVGQGLSGGARHGSNPVTSKLG